MTDGKEPEPRRHHFVPRCWLSGFTETGDKDGQLWVTDFARRKQWQTSPGNAGFIRDFYRLSDDRFDPVIVEKALSKIEGEIAPILKSIDEGLREPDVDELEALLYFIAIQWARVPSFRPFALKILDSLTRDKLAEALRSKESWKKALEKAEISADAPGADYESMKEFERSGDFSLSASTDWYVQRAFKAAEDILPSLKRRIWRTAFSPSGSFIGCDNPVILEGPKGQLMGFENAEIVTYALSRHVLLYATHRRVRPPVANRKDIAHMNTLSLLRAEEQVFSHVPDFCWMSQSREYQTDWALFSKDKY